MADLSKALEINLEEPIKHPVIACSPVELERLREAYSGSGPEHEIVAVQVQAAERVVDQPIEFPGRGGQHNQWYQCDQCQMGLETIDDTHHRCPTCGTVYSGTPYDDVIFSRQHGRNMANARVAAWAYAITDDERFARYTRSVLLGYADRYLKYPYHKANLATTGRGGGHILEQSLSEASMCAINTAPAYDLIHDSGVLSATDHRTIREGLIVPMLENIDRHKCGIGNWQTWHNAAMITAGAVIGDASWVQKALNQKGNGFFHQMEHSVSDDGMWYENSWGYHFYALRAMVIIAESARRLGIDLWSHPNLKAMFTLPMSYTMADGSLPRFGDDVNTTLSRHTDLFEVAFHAYEEPEFLPYLAKDATWNTVMYGRNPGEGGKMVPEPQGSKVFEKSGHAILRTKGAAGLTAAITFSPFGGFHGHFDKLSFVFFGYGKELGVDPGRAKSQAYRLPIHGEWYRSTIGHNTVLVDGKSQEPAAGVLKHFVANDEYAAVVVSCTGAYPGVDHRRWLCLSPTYLLVYDQLWSFGERRRFDWMYHNRGSGVRCESATQPVDLSGEEEGYRYLDNTRRGEFEQGFQAAFDDTAVTTHLLFPFWSGKVTVGDGPGESIADRVPFVMVTREGDFAYFLTILEPVQGGREPTISAGDVFTIGVFDTFSISVNVNGKRESFGLHEDRGFSIWVDGEQLVGEAFTPVQFEPGIDEIILDTLPPAETDEPKPPEEERR